jgi:ABC-type bacteriocin/lantibiotic exporter with double-glycine peptidase domain
VIELYKAIWGVSARRQIFLILLAIAISALAAAPLKFQKDIINGLTATDLDPNHLYALCGGMISLIALSLGLKWLMGYLSSILGEDVVRVIRTRIYTNAVSGGSQSKNTIEPGTLATMISAEAEELGKFTGSAFSEPVVQFGTLVSVIGFIAATQPYLGAIALCMIVPQVVIVLQTQGQVNALVADRVHILRGATDKTLSSEFSKLDQSVIDDFDTIYETRRKIFIWKLSTKFVLSLINGIGLVGVLALGGTLVLKGGTDVGTVVAATIGLGRLQSPTSFLIAFYRQVSATRVKYELLRDAASP